MSEFLQSYGTWIILAGFFILMLRMHTGGGGCGMGHADHDTSAKSEQDRATSPTTADQDHATTHTSKGCH